MIVIGLMGPPSENEEELVRQLIGVTQLVENAAHRLQEAGIHIECEVTDGEHKPFAEHPASNEAVMALWTTLVECAKKAGPVPDKIPGLPIPETNPNAPIKPLNRANEG